MPQSLQTEFLFTKYKPAEQNLQAAAEASSDA
jgi:hypothetical protein